MADGQSGALFSSNGDFVLLDEFADVFESHRRFVEFHLVMFSKRIHHVGSRDRLTHSVFPAPAFDQIIEQQGDDLIGLKECTVFVHNAKAVGIAVGGDPDVGFHRAHLLAHGFEQMIVGLGRVPAE